MSNDNSNERINDDVRQRPLIVIPLSPFIITQMEMMSVPNFFLIFQNIAAATTTTTMTKCQDNFSFPLFCMHLSYIHIVVGKVERRR